MSISDQDKKTLHLHSRAAFGLKPGELADWSKKSITDQVEKLFKDSETISLLSIVPSDNTDDDPKVMDDSSKQKMRMEQKKYLRDLNLAWMNRLAGDSGRLRERMTLFWHGHFACRFERAAFVQELNNIHRKNALGKFKDLLLAVSKSAAMLFFLNNQQNKKQHPNENFARELMELFTIGRGNYTENDVKEAARAFTGWSCDRKTGAFQLRDKAHDEGSKTFMGETGMFGGEDIIDMLLKKKQTAVFITRKIYKYLVNDTPDEKKVESLADDFYKSDYDIGKLVKSILTGNFFYEATNTGEKIKSPVELMTGIHYLFNVQYDKPDAELFFQRALGQTLFFPPNVAGWPGGQAWIDSSTLMHRLNLASILVNEGGIAFEAKDDMPEDFMKSTDDDALGAPEIEPMDKADMLTPMAIPAPRKVRKVKTTVAWDDFWKNIPKGWTSDDLIHFLLRPELTAPVKKLLVDYTDDKKKDFVVQLLSLPEYQMT